MAHQNDARQPLLDAINEAIMAAEGADPVTMDDLDAFGVQHSAHVYALSALDICDLTDAMLDLSLSRVGHDWS